MERMDNAQSPEASPLGKATQYQDSYNSELLFSIPRKQSRKELDVLGELPFRGNDLWTAYELSWLNQKGKPEVAIGEFLFPCFSPNIVESKSFKLYLNSLNQTKFDSQELLVETLRKDLTLASGEAVDIELYPVDSYPLKALRHEKYIRLDSLDIDVNNYSLNPGLLELEEGSAVVHEQLVTHLFKSNCPITNQPDWASLYIDYDGAQINHEALLKYIISYRSCAEFHEQCVERLFLDIMERCSPQKLTVQARFVRRGGLDINPIRSSELDFKRLPRVTRQ